MFTIIIELVLAQGSDSVIGCLAQIPASFLPSTLMESLPVEAIVAVQQFLAAVDLLACEGITQAWKEVARREGWKTVYRREVGTSTLALLGQPKNWTQPERWKHSFFIYQFLRIVPGERAGGLRLRSRLHQHRWHQWEYCIQASQFLELGPAACSFGRRRLRGKQLARCFKVVSAYYSWVAGSYDMVVWTSTRGPLGIIEAVTICCPELGALYLPDRPHPANIRVGTLLSDLLALLDIGLEDLRVIGESCKGIHFEFAGNTMPGLKFTLDCRPEHLWGTQSLRWNQRSTIHHIAACVHHPICEITVDLSADNSESDDDGYATQ